MTVLTEGGFQSMVIEAAQRYGWKVAHFRPAQVRPGVWVTPVQADGAGFPDLVLVRERVVFAELKTRAGRLRDEQAEWLNQLEASGAEVYLWRPGDWDEIARILRTVCS